MGVGGERLTYVGRPAIPAAMRALLLLLLVATLWVTGCGGPRYGGLSRRTARAKATEIAGDLRAVVPRGRFQLLTIRKVTLKGRHAWKAEFYFLTGRDEHADPLTPAHPPPLFCVYVWSAGSTVRIDASGKFGC